ncbi:hypothetical protein GCM10027169_03690 [Gordonia jinhuaensis]|uniref:Uncharacterized protein n=1 Tax=Gordonia jinhuaensis TaxID=1517702 RepID=A0A916SVW6_9ACTN|nr:hypothetical protein GCM10011489_00640 [Gordonia jinhuaensis]
MLRVWSPDDDPHALTLGMIATLAAAATPQRRMRLPRFPFHFTHILLDDGTREA